MVRGPDTLPVHSYLCALPSSGKPLAPGDLLQQVSLRQKGLVQSLERFPDSTSVIFTSSRQS